MSRIVLLLPHLNRVLPSATMIQCQSVCWPGVQCCHTILLAGLQTTQQTCILQAFAANVRPNDVSFASKRPKCVFPNASIINPNGALGQCAVGLWITVASSERQSEHGHSAVDKQACLGIHTRTRTGVALCWTVCVCAHHDPSPNRRHGGQCTHHCTVH